MQPPAGSLHLPPALLAHWHTEIALLVRLRARNAAQHRSGLFFRRVGEVERLGRRVEEGLGGIVAGNGEREVKELEVLVKRILPALVRATDSVNKMIHHLHFLPFTTVLLAIYARLWHLALNLQSYTVAWRESAALAASTGQLGLGLGLAVPPERGEPQSRTQPHRKELDVADVLLAATASPWHANQLQRQDEAAGVLQRRRARQANRRARAAAGAEAGMGLGAGPEAQADGTGAVDLGMVVSREEAEMVAGEYKQGVEKAVEAGVGRAGSSDDETQRDLQDVTPPNYSSAPLAEQAFSRQSSSLDVTADPLAAPSILPPRSTDAEVQSATKPKKPKKRKDALDAIFGAPTMVKAEGVKGSPFGASVMPTSAVLPRTLALPAAISTHAPDGFGFDVSSAKETAKLKKSAMTEKARPAKELSTGKQKKTKKKVSAMDDIFGF